MTETRPDPEANKAASTRRLQGVLAAVSEASLHPETWPAALAAATKWLAAAGGILHIGLGGPDTAHAQLRIIFEKTGTTNQSELLRLLHRGAAAIRPYENSSEHQPVRL
jgi:hypothetical protein